MFCVIYKFKIKDEMNEQFERSWAEFTDSIYRVRGSLGSRLHKTEDPQIYVAYAQRPSKEVFDKVVPDSQYSDSDLKSRNSMIEAVDGKIDRTYLNVFDDRLEEH